MIHRITKMSHGITKMSHRSKKKLLPEALEGNSKPFPEALEGNNKLLPETLEGNSKERSLGLLCLKESVKLVVDDVIKLKLQFYKN